MLNRTAALLLMKFEIVCDSSADLPESYVKESNITVVSFYVSMDGKNYLREGKDISVSDFYQTMVDHDDCYPKTSMPSVQDYIDAFTPIVKKGMPVLCICLTKKFSGSLQSAMTAKMAVEDEYENAQIYVMDSQLVTALQGLLVTEAVRLRDKDMELKDAAAKLEETRSSGRIFFTTKDLKYLEHGGRLGKVACIAGSMLNLKPILTFSNGELETTKVCRGRKKSLERVVDNFFQYLNEKKIDLKDYLFGTGIGLDIPEYEEFINMLKEKFDEYGIHPETWIKVNIGATIGVHTGPYPIGLGILKKCDI